MKATRFRLHTLVHKFWVFSYLGVFALKLIWRGLIHDSSKFSTLEAEGFGECLPKLRESSYGERDYQDLLDQTQAILNHHYTHNRHHPEHFQHGYSEMDLIDVVEMLCDWQASIKKHQDGNIITSIEYCKQRFDMSEDIVKIFLNTVKKKR
ncbi:MAG: hypothetical protein GY801_30775 [bacterium]|nr:hypothetical protein [bacterium]